MYIRFLGESTDVACLSDIAVDTSFLMLVSHYVHHPSNALQASCYSHAMDGYAYYGTLAMLGQVTVINIYRKLAWRGKTNENKYPRIAKHP